MKLLGKVKGITGDLIYSVLGLVVMHGVIQLVLYPTMNGSLGAERFGTVLTLISFISIMSATFGTAANYSRMVSFQKGRYVLGDYNLFLLGVAALAIPVAIVGMWWLGGGSVLHYGLYILLMVVTIVRYYADVEFRLNINYKRFFVYYLLISIGYLVGICIFKVTGIWSVVLLIGEVSAVLYVVVKGHIFNTPLLASSKHIKDNFKSFAILSGTEIIATLVLHADRLLLQAMVDSTAVTVFYGATLIGKTISLISVPFNGVLIGHLARFKGKLKRSTYAGVCVGSVGLALIINVVATAVSYVFVALFYPDVYELAKEYFFIANLGQILYFISNTLTVVLLRFSEEKYQLYINVVYMIVFACVAIPMTYIWGIWGMALALIVVNVVKILTIMIVGWRVLCRY